MGPFGKARLGEGRSARRPPNRAGLPHEGLGPGRLPLDPRAGRAPRDLRLPAAGRYGARALGGREPRALRVDFRGARGPCAGIAIWN